MQSRYQFLHDIMFVFLPALTGAQLILKTLLADISIFNNLITLTNIFTFKGPLKLVIKEL